MTRLICRMRYCVTDVESGSSLPWSGTPGAPLARRMFALWREAVDAPLQWEFSEALARHFA